MIRRLCLLCITLLPAAFAQETVFWQGRSAGYDVRWSSANIEVRQGSRVVLNLAAVEQRDWLRFQRSLREDRLSKTTPTQMVQEHDEFQIASLVGPYLSLLVSRTAKSGPLHQSHLVRFQTLDLRRQMGNELTEIPLTDLFPLDQILRALLANEMIRRGMMPGNNNRDFLSWQSFYVHTMVFAMQGCPLSLRLEPSNFAFYGIDGGRALIRLSLSNAETCGDQVGQVELPLAIRAPLQTALESAAQKRAGFLMHDARPENLANSRADELLDQPLGEPPTTDFSFVTTIARIKEQ